MAFSSAAKITHEYVQALTSVREQSSRNIEASRSIVRQEVFDCSQYFDHLHVGYRELKHSMASLEVETMKADLATCVHNISQICTKMHRLEQVLDTLCERRDKDLVTVWQERKALELDKLQHRHKEEYHRREAQLNAQRVNQQRFHRARAEMMHKLETAKREKRAHIEARSAAGAIAASPSAPSKQATSSAAQVSAVASVKVKTAVPLSTPLPASTLAASATVRAGVSAKEQVFEKEASTG